ncbi:hypothetical protein F0562_025987 [Nyssa sinensis]|uniref:Uncharacterized protein n=1 Tax=Nyssa sinensis TaxID=561372 RepID=A0A5J5B7R8_9ASTE|nr:hypothetical protein F0562_025987 [Nyssa sinensis]
MRSEQLRFGVNDGQVETDRFDNRRVVRVGLGGEGVGGDVEDEDVEGLEGRGGVVVEEGGGDGSFSGRAEVAEALEDAANWWMSLWMCGASDLVARRILGKIGLQIGRSSGNAVLGMGAGGGGGAAAAIIFSASEKLPH